MQIPGSEENPGFLIMGLNGAVSRTCACEVPHQETWAHQQVPRFPGVTAVGSLARRVSLAWDQAGQWPACAISKKWGPHLSLKNQVWGLTPAGKVRGMAFQKASRDSHSVSQSMRGDPQDPFRDSLGSSFPNRHDVHFLCRLQPKQPTGRDQTQSSRYEDSAVFQVSHTRKRFTKL